MKSKEDELISVQYRIEKSGMKQQKLEENLISISKELKKSKRNSVIFSIFFLVVIATMAAGMYYLSNKNATTNSSDQIKENAVKANRIQLMNDSLHQELTKLKSDITNYRKELVMENDSFSSTLSANKIVTAITDSANAEASKKPKYVRKHGYVKNVFRTGDAIFVEIDFIEYFEGKKAVEKAKENGEAELEIDKAGDTLYFLYNNYYVYNKKTKLIRLELDEKVRVSGVNQISKGFSIKAFQKIITDNPIMVLEVDNGIVYKITKQKLP